MVTASEDALLHKQWFGPKKASQVHPTHRRLTAWHRPVVFDKSVKLGLHA